MTITLDLGVDDVHAPGTAGSPKVKQMAEISTASRKALPADKFALPSLRKYPIHDAEHTRNAAARLEQNKDTLTASQYAEARRNIARAARGFGIKSEYAKRASSRKGLRMRIAQDGSIDVHHMMKDGGMCMPGLVELKASDGPVWIQIAKTGTFRGYKDGAFTLDSKTFDEIVRNFNGTENKRVPIDFEHASEAKATDGTIPVLGAPAQGWITALDNRGSELWGQVEWGELAQRYIKDGSYKYLSPAIRLNQRDRETGLPIGARLTSAALTNIPFLDGMKALAARDFDEQPLTAEEEAGMFVELCWLNDYGSHYDIPGVRHALKLDDFASFDDILSRCARLREMYRDPEQSAGVDLDSVTNGLREFTRIPLHVDIYQALEGIEDFIEALIPSDEYEEQSEQQASQAAAADKANAEEVITMNEPKTVLLTEHESTVAALNLQLKDATAKVTEATTKVSALEAENVALKEAIANRDKADAERTKKERATKVDTAFLSYKETRKLTDDDKEAMALLLDSGKEELFNKLYPPIAANLLPLTQRITQQREVPVVREIPAASKGSDIKTLADKHMKEGKTYDEAFTIAINEAAGTVAL